MVEAHAGQTRRYSGLPYHSHPQRVADLIAGVIAFPSDDVLIAGLLHDTVEDTQVTRERITEQFGSPVAAIVDLVTHRTSHKLDTVYRLRAPRDPDLVRSAWTVFLADKAANATDLFWTAQQADQLALTPADVQQCRRQMTWIQQAVSGFPYDAQSELNALVRLAEYHVDRASNLLRGR